MIERLRGDREKNNRYMGDEVGSKMTLMLDMSFGGVTA